MNRKSIRYFVLAVGVVACSVFQSRAIAGQQVDVPGTKWELKIQIPVGDDYWNGVLKFFADGTYSTDWGVGHWTQDATSGDIVLANDYDGLTHSITFSSQKEFTGLRVDGYILTGRRSGP